MRLESVVRLDESFKQWIKNTSIDSSKSLSILQKLFGPNSNCRFTFKSNLPLFVDIAHNISEEHIKEYITYSQELFKIPNLNEFYPVDEHESDEEDDKGVKEKQKANKEDNIRIYVLNTLVNTITIFENHSEHSLKDVINFIVYQAFFQESLSDNIKEFAKDKLFAIVEGLYKRKDYKTDENKNEELASSLENKSMWVTEINKTIGRYALEGNEFNTIDQTESDKKKKTDNKHKLKLGMFIQIYSLEIHKSFMEFGGIVKKQRKRVYKLLSKLGDKEKEQKELFHLIFKKAAGLEILVYVLALFCPIAPEETQEDLQEIQLSYEKIALEDEIELAKVGKTQKVAKDDVERDQAYQILFDFLISLLTRQNSTLRDITNFTFKAFCHELNSGSLSNILSILNTPNMQASKILVAGDEEQPLMEMDEEDGQESENEEDESEISDEQESD
jgi:hypothetical protein